MSAPLSEGSLEVATLSDAGTEREHNEDCCGFLVESQSRGVVAIADGVSGHAGGQTASKMAIDVLLRAYREHPESLGAAKRLWRAVQQANIELYELAVVVPELLGMATTLTAIAVDEGGLSAAHIGDSRLYLLRHGEIKQLTKDHTVAGERVRMGLLSEAKARRHPGRSVLTRSLGRELIVAIDRFTTELAQGDILVLCSDGLYNVLDDAEIARHLQEADAAASCRSLIDAANRRGTPDNLTVAVVRVTGAVPAPRSRGFAARFRRLFR